MPLQIIDTSYAGTFASYFWLPATFGMDTVQKGIVHVQDNITKAHTIGRIDFSNPIQRRTATPTGGGTFSVDGRVLTPQDMMIYAEFNPRDFEQHWLAPQMSDTLLSREVPVTAKNIMLQLALNRSFEQVENGIWMGSTTYTAADGTPGNGQIKYFDGFIKKMVNDAAVLKVASPLPLTAGVTSGGATNVADAMDGLLLLMASNKKALLSNPNRYKRLKFICSIATEMIYQTYITTSTIYKGVNTTEQGINKYKGFEIVPTAGCPDNTIVLCEATDTNESGLHIGMNSTQDNNLLLDKLAPNSELFFIKGLMKFDTQYSFSEHVFLFTTLTSGTFTA